MGSADPIGAGPRQFRFWQTRLARLAATAKGPVQVEDRRAMDNHDWIALYGTEEPPQTADRASPRRPDGGVGGRQSPAHPPRAGGSDPGHLLIARDRNWGTLYALIEGLEIDRGTDTFTVRFLATVKDDVQSFHIARPSTPGKMRSSYRIRRCRVRVRDEPTGFVVLHPVGIAGQAVSIERVDGSVEQGRFPELIDPSSDDGPARPDARGRPGLRVTCRMEGDAYEMEDQRNLVRRFLQTYVRLSRALAYRLAQGETLRHPYRSR